MMIRKNNSNNNTNGLLLGFTAKPHFIAQTVFTTEIVQHKTRQCYTLRLCVLIFPKAIVH